MATNPIELNYRLLRCGCCFMVSLKELPICHSADPVLDTALFLKEAGIADEATIRMRLEGTDMGISYTLSDIISSSEDELDVPPKSDNRTTRRLH